MDFPRLVIGGTHSGVGKTTVTLALLAALHRRGRRVQPFKIGPDFIDPGHHSAVSGRPSRNLDGWMLGPEVNRRIFVHGASGADLSIIEGMMGLFDGSSPTHDQGSTAQMAKLLDAPVVLVIDGSAMARSVAAMALGYARFDPALRVRAVIFNKVSGEKHYRLLQQAIEAETDLAVAGYLKRDTALHMPERHLGLVTALEQRDGASLYARLADAAATIDLERLEAVARAVPHLEAAPADQRTRHPTIRVGLAYDSAFCFYYPENLEALEMQGAEIVRFSPLEDRSLPAVDLLYLGGGYPELYAAKLTENSVMRLAIQQYVADGGALYAECGGLMYLMERIRDFENTVYAMVGLFPGEAIMSRTKLTLGYREVEITQPCLLGKPGVKARGHEFHYSHLSLTEKVEYGCKMSDAQGRECGQDGLIRANALGLYTHLHFATQPEVVRSLLNVARAQATSERL